MKLSIHAALCAVAALAPAADAAEIVAAGVDRVQESYHVEFVVMIDGTVERVREIIMDHGRLDEISPSVKSSRLVGGGRGLDPRIEVVLRPCVMIVLCRTITKVSDIRIEPQTYRIHYEAVPGLGDFHEARETITMKQASREGVPRVRFSYTAVLKPAFYVPPLAGPWLIRRAIVRDLAEATRRVERMIQRDRG